MRHDEDRRVERRLLRPRLLAEVEHALAHHARAGALERLPGDVVVHTLLTALAELQVLPEEPQREDPLLQFHPLRRPALRLRVVRLLLGRDEPVQRHGHTEEDLPGHRALHFLPNELGDVGGRVAEGLLAALDRVVRLDRLVAQLLGREHRVHLDPGRRAVGRECDDRLEGVRVAAGLTVQQRNPLRPDDLGPGDPLLVVRPVRSCITKSHSPPTRNSNDCVVVVNPSGPPPPRQVLDFGERLEHQLPVGRR